MKGFSEKFRDLSFRPFHPEGFCGIRLMIVTGQVAESMNDQVEDLGLQGNVLFACLPVCFFGGDEYLAVRKGDLRSRGIGIGKRKDVRGTVFSAEFLVDPTDAAIVDEGDRVVFLLFPQTLLCLVCQEGKSTYVHWKLSLAIFNLNGHSEPPVPGRKCSFSVRKESLWDRGFDGDISTPESG